MEEKSASLFQDWLQPDLSWLDGLVYNRHHSLSSWLLTHSESIIYKISSRHRADLCLTLSTNPAAIPFLLHHPIYATHNGILSNPNPWAMEWIQPTLDQLADPSFNFRANRESVLYALSRNENPLVVEWLQEYVPLEHQYWYCLSMNPSAIDFLLENPSMIHWETFTSNSHPRAIEHMAAHPEMMDTEPYGYINVMLQNKCPAAGPFLLSVGREDLYRDWTYRHGSLEEMDLEHMADSSLNEMAENPKALSYFKERPHLIQDRIFHLASNPAIFL